MMYRYGFTEGMATPPHAALLLGISRASLPCHILEAQLGGRMPRSSAQPKMYRYGRLWLK